MRKREATTVAVGVAEPMAGLIRQAGTTFNCLRTSSMGSGM